MIALEFREKQPKQKPTMLSLHLPADVTPRDVAKMMQMPGEIEVKDRSTFFNKYPNCFIAKEAVSWLIKRNLSRTRDDAVSTKEKKKIKNFSYKFSKTKKVAVGRRLLAEGFIYNVSHDKDFQDNGHYYSFSSTIAEKSATSSSAEASTSNNATTASSSNNNNANRTGSTNGTSGGGGAASTGSTAAPGAAAGGQASKQKSVAASLPKLRGHLEVWEESGGLFSSSWKRRYYVLDRKTKQLLFYPETMEQALGNVDMSRIAMIGPTGDGWVFQLMVEMDHDSAEDMRNVTGADEFIDGKPYKRTLLRARSHEEMAYWVDGLIRWVDVFRTLAKEREVKAAAKPVDEKTTLLSALQARAEARIAAASTRRADESAVAQQQLQSQLSAAHDQLAASEKRVGELLVALNEARSQLLRSSGGGRVRSSTIQGDDDADADESVQAPADDKFCMRPACAAQRDELRHATLALQETQSKLDRTLEDIAVRDAAAADAAAAVAASAAANAAAVTAATAAATPVDETSEKTIHDLRQALEEQFEVLDGMQQRLTASETRNQELEAENEVLLEKLAEMQLTLEGEGAAEMFSGGGGDEELQRGDD
jgi:hypothetical protein